MTVIGFIGPGIMGMPMAANLVSAGHDVRVYGRSERSRSRAEQTKARVVGSVREACEGANIAITMLPDSPDVLEVALADDGVFASLAPGASYIDHSTISPQAAVRLHDEARSRGIASLDAPVSGGESGAVEASLSIMVGGDEAAFERLLPVLRAVGTTIVHVGADGSGQVVKAANQMVVAGNIQILAEAIVFLEKHGVELSAAMDVLGGGLAGSTVLSRKRSAFLEDRFDPGFRMRLHDKDLGIAVASIRDAGLSLPATSLLSSLVAASCNRGDGDLDHSALLKLVREFNTRA